MLLQKLSKLLIYYLNEIFDKKMDESFARFVLWILEMIDDK